ncbi:DUF4286 family protein [Novosphingobium malaysiense]|uniref:DUF4286 family protein n=1 Tax=Novosphingobium malaysiense TaxID=1348853 RepID=UPI0009DCE31B|nr:DUF4286 family protein [Novosphingobium malaysiense]
MASFVMVVQSKARDGRDEEYNAWYDSEHLADVLALPGVKSGRRFDFERTMMGEPGLPYLAIFEIEAVDADTVITAMGQRSADGSMSTTDAVDGPASVLWFYRERD